MTSRLKKLSKSLEASSKGLVTAKSATSITEFFKNGEQLADLKGWKIVAGLITAPKPKKGKEAIFVTKGVLSGEFLIKLEVNTMNVRGDEHQELQALTTRFPTSEREEWMPIIIEVSKTRLGYKVGKLHMRYLPRPSDMKGKVGLRVSPSQPGKTAPQFRKLEILRL